ncbi:MAG TPA: type ISP restriction/modification enzyme, partial [Chloroflexota bacterium]
MRNAVPRQLADRWQALCEQGLDPREAERSVFDDWLAGSPRVDEASAWTIYEDFLRICEPGRRRARGVYTTPMPVVRAQVRLVDDVLRRLLGCEGGFADERVTIVDPATGSGVYPQAILDQVAEGLRSDVRGRMRLFEAMPGAAAVARAQGLSVEERDALTTRLSLDAPIVVCLGNPPYRRGVRPTEGPGSLDTFVHPAAGLHLKNLYNEYVYFWSWALRVTCESRSGAALVCLVTAASYLRGPGFAGMRHSLRRELDDLWLLDLEGDHRAARASHNVFPIRTPVVIALGARYGPSARHQPARVHYARLSGERRQKLASLESLQRLGDLAWRPASDGWCDPLVAAEPAEYQTWPALVDLFPWQISGAQMKRTWPIGATPDVLRARWKRLLALPPAEQARAFRQTRDRTLDSAPPDLADGSRRLVPLRELEAGSPCLEPVRYAYRSFDRQWVLPDARLGDFMRPALWRVAGPRQVFVTSLLTAPLGDGPALVATGCVPDLDHFRGSFGGRAVMPLWCDAAASRPNVARTWLARLSRCHGRAVGAEELMAYCYALLSWRGFTRRFEEQLRAPGARVPLTTRAGLFRRGVALGERLLSLHTYRRVPVGKARCITPVGDVYPTGFAYDAAARSLRVGEQAWFRPIAPEAWAFAVSGYMVIPAWLAHRLPRTGKSTLDAIGPEAWTQTLTDELL